MDWHTSSYSFDCGKKGGDWALSQNEQVSTLAKLGGRFCLKKNVFSAGVSSRGVVGWFIRFIEWKFRAVSLTLHTTGMTTSETEDLTKKVLA